MRKAEMESHSESYARLTAQACEAERLGRHRDAIEYARRAFQHIDGMMRYAQKYEDAEFGSIEAIDLVLRYAPALLDQESIDSAAALLKKSRRIEKHTSDSQKDSVARANEMLQAAYLLWDQVERNPDQDFNAAVERSQVDPITAQEVLSAWVELDLMTDNGGRVEMQTRLHTLTAAKCAACGVATEAPKAFFLEDMLCPTCNVEADFVIQ